MQIEIKENTYLGNTKYKKVNAEPYYGVGPELVGYGVLGKSLIAAGVYKDIDPNFEYFLKTHQVKVIKP